MSKTTIPLGALLFLIGCGPDAPSVRYSGNTLAAKAASQMKVYRATPPERAYQEMGTVDVSCPTSGQAGPFGHMSIEGGCTFDNALQMATERAADAGADGVFNIQTSAGGNGSIVSLTAVAFRFTGAPASNPPPDGGKVVAKPSLEDRLKRLKELADQGLITPEEYARRKGEVLKEL